MLTALPTTYNGQVFRSRLEARWAFFMNALEIPWEYEKEAYQLDTVVYVPDFWLPSLSAWLEVKGDLISDPIALTVIRKCTQLACLSSRPVILAFNDPLHQRCAVFGVKGGFYSDAHFTTCLICGGFGVSVRLPTGARVLCPNRKEHQTATIEAVRAARERAFAAAIEARNHRFSISRKAA